MVTIMMSPFDEETIMEIHIENRMKDAVEKVMAEAAKKRQKRRKRQAVRRRYKYILTLSKEATETVSVASYIILIPFVLSSPPGQ